MFKSYQKQDMNQTDHQKTIVIPVLYYPCYHFYWHILILRLSVGMRLQPMIIVRRSLTLAREEGQEYYVYRIRSSTSMVWVGLSSVVMEWYTELNGKSKWRKEDMKFEFTNT